MKTYVLYHANCADGSGAAYAAWKKLGDDSVEYIAVQYGSEPPEIESGSTVYILDFSYPREVLEALKARVSTLVVLDHHKTAKEALEGFQGAHFDMEKSGAVLAWEYFHPGAPVPDVLLHIQDRDLWQWKLPGTKEVSAGLLLYPSFQDYSYAKVEDLKLAGKYKGMYDDLTIEKAVKHVARTVYNPEAEKPFICSISNTTSLISEIGNAMCTSCDIDFSLSYFITNSGEVVFSFRSIGDFDVSVLAKALGGGGHKNAAGAKLGKDVGFILLSALYNHVITD